MDYEKINELKKLHYISDNSITTDDLFLKDENNETFFEYIIKNNISILNSKITRYISNNYDLLRYAIENKYVLNEYGNIDLLFEKKDITLIELLYRNDPFQFSNLSSDILNRLFVKNNDKYPLENLLNVKNIYSLTSVIRKISDPKMLYNCLKDINRLDLMNYANEECLISTSPNGITILQELIDNNISLNFDTINNEEIIKILYDNQKYNLVLNADCQILLTKPSLSTNYLDLLIQKYKNGENIGFDAMRPDSNDKKFLAQTIIKLLKNDINFKIYTHDLISQFDFINKPVIIQMLEIDKNLTLDFINKYNMQEEIKKYVANINNVSLNDFQNFNINNIENYLPKIDKVVEKIQNKKITKISQKDIFAEDLLKHLDSGITLLEFALQNNIDVSNFDSFLGKQMEAVLIFVNYNRNIPSIDEHLLFEDISSDKKLIDLLIEKGEIETIISSSKNNLQIMDYCIKYNRFDIMSNSILKKLLTEQNGKLLIESYLDNEKLYSNIIEKLYPDIDLGLIEDSILVKLYNKGCKKLLTHANEEVLLTEYNGTTILEDLLKSKMDPVFICGIELAQTMEILHKNNRPDLMNNAKLNLLMNYPNKDNNYLQYMIDACKAGTNVHFEYGSYKTENDKELLARFYIQMTNNNISGYLEDLISNDLVSKDKNGKSLLYYLINIDKDLTLKEILSFKEKIKPEVFTELKLLGISDSLININYTKFQCSDIYRKQKNSIYDENMVSPVDDLLNELESLFENDGHSDKEIISALITSYKYSTSVNPIMIEEVKQLIEIKKNNPDFYYLKKIDGGYFSCFDKAVIVENSTISTLNHETGHAIHYFLADFQIPENYDSLIHSIANSPDWLGKVEQYSNKFKEIYNYVKSVSENIIDSYISEETVSINQKEIHALLNETKEKQKQMYLEKGYSDETISIILDGTFTAEEFMRQKKDIEIHEMNNTLMEYNYDAFIAIGDIVDAITVGKFRSDLLKNEKNETIKSGYGHGIRYYSARKEVGFHEMIANYSSIIKSKKCNENIELLRYIVGDELVDLLENFYNNNILKIDYEKDESLNGYTI